MLLLTLLAVGFGLLCGILTSVTPGLNSMNAALMSSVIGVINPVCVPVSVFCAITISMFLSSAKEGVSPELSGNASLIAASPVNSGIDLTKQTFNSKVAGAIVGMGTALLMSYFGVVISTSAVFTISVALFMVYVLCASFNRHTMAILGYLGFVQLFFMVANMMNIANPVYLLLTAIFVIPATLRANEARPLSEDEKNETSAEPTKSLLGMIVSFICPGVGSSLVINGLSRKMTPDSQLSSSFCESALEGFCLVGLSAGIASGKSLLAMEIGLAGFSSWFLFLFIGLVFLSWYLLPAIKNVFQNVSSIPGVHLFACAASVSTCVLLAGLPGLIICGLGLLVSMMLRALNVPSTVLSLTFLSPILF